MPSPMPEPPPFDDLDWGPPPDPEPWLPDDLPPLEQVEPSLSPPAAEDAGWSWQDARLIGVERVDEDGPRYEVGALSVYADARSGDLGGQYLPIADFYNVDVATAYYDQLHDQMAEQGVPVEGLPAFAEQQARAMHDTSEGWRSADPPEYSAYQHLHNLEASDLADRDVPPAGEHEDLLHTALRLGGVDTPDLEDRTAFQALSAIGVQAEGFDPAADPPPFYDAQTGTAYWIGVFQPDREDPEHCLTSILSLGRSPETGAVEAQLAPCVPGDWDKAYAAAEYLIGVAQKGGIEVCFDAAEGMALATEQRPLWETPLGVPLEPGAARQIAAYTEESWEVEL